METKETLENLLEKIKKEHHEVHETVEYFEKKDILTPHEERQLSVLRKKKLLLKDKMAVIIERLEDGDESNS